MSVQVSTYDRREFLRLTAAAAGVACIPFGGCYSKTIKPAGDTAKRPNIIYIIADDLGWADIEYHGSEIKTPNLDRLAHKGVRFEKHYVMATCTPTRVGLMSGRYPSRFGVTCPAYGKIFDDDTVTLATALRNRGYDTAITGKWHMGSPPEYTPLKYGFNQSYGYFSGQIDPYTHNYKTGERAWHRNDKYLDEEGHATDLITDEAVRIVESEHQKPFFLYVAYSVPHYPLDEPEKWTSMYKKIEPASRRWYAASVTHMDDGIGRIIKAVNRSGLSQNTLLIFVSDNGGQKSWRSEVHYKGRYADKPHTVLGNNLPLRGWKCDLYEGGIRVPALACWPGVIKPGSLSAPVHIVDWMPTLCSLTGYQPKKDLKWDGRNIWPLISGETRKYQPRTMYWKTPGSVAVRQGDWKLITDKNGRHFELYNLDNDPYEKNNLAAKQPQRVDELKKLLEDIVRDDR